MRDAIAAVVEGRDLQPEAMQAAMGAMLTGEATPVQVAALLVGLRMKGETAEELTAAAEVMRRHAVPVELSVDGCVLDTCGTGGDGSGSFNISTVSAIVVAACGVTVAKHGNRAASSKCGSADVLEALGLDLAMSATDVGRCISSIGIGFMFARAHHPAMKNVGPIRAELAIRTMFNLLGPVTNPAGATHQLLGMGDGTKLNLMAEVLKGLGTKAAWVVHGDGGLDEVSLSGPTRVVTLRDGAIGSMEVRPEDFGVEPAPQEALAGGDAEQNAAIARAILAGEKGPRRDAVVINAGAALCVAGVASSPREGAERAAEAIDSAAAAQKLSAWVAFGGE